MALNDKEIKEEIIAIEATLKYHRDAIILNERGIRVNEFILELLKARLSS